MELFNRAQSIQTALAHPRLKPRYRKELESVSYIRDFIRRAGLEATQSYQEFVDLERESVVWVVSACKPLQFEAQRWSFPIVGSFTYLGWFNPEDAQEMQSRLEQEGFDADVRGAAAYSTLGWFRDPVISTLLGAGPGALAETLIHESVHSTLHLKNQSTLNESMAQFVAEKLTPLYLEEQGGEKSRKEYEGTLLLAHSRKTRLRRAYHELQSIYGSGAPDSEKLKLKQSRLESLRTELSWPQKRTLNNATLIQFATYESGGEGFEAIWRACGGKLTRFLKVIRDAESTLARVQDSGLEEALVHLTHSCGAQ
jgi:predicted aminopeptidase